MNLKTFAAHGGLLLAFTSLAGQTARAQIDPGVPGPFEISRLTYDFGDTDQEYFGRPYETRAVLWYPTDLSQGPFPIVVFLHGWHPTCYVNVSFFTGEWPCNAALGHAPIPSYLGYEYEQQILASYGYIVVSVSANGVNARDAQFTDVGMDWRAILTQQHLDLWNSWNTEGGAPFEDPSMFIGAVDLTRVGTMGHSRGGGGVARHYNYNRELGSPYGVKAVLPLAPVDFSRVYLDNVNIQVILPYCDGDVADLQGVHYFDDARYFAGDQTNKLYTLVMGGNHSYFNTIWTPGGWPAATWDDWVQFEDPGRRDPWCADTQPGNHKLTPEQERGVLQAYATGFFRLYVGGETAFLPLFKGDVPPPPSAMTTEIFSTYHASVAHRLDVNRNLSGGDGGLTTNTLGGAVLQAGLSPYDKCGGEDPEPARCLPPPNPDKRQPHTTPSRVFQRPGLSQVRFGWDAANASLTNEIPGGGDVSGYSAVQFRAVVNFDDARNAGAQDLSLILTDGNGNSSSVLVSGSSGALYFPPGLADGPLYRAVPKVVLSAVRIPLSAFVGVDLTNIADLTMSLDRTKSGALLLSDLAFSD